MDGNIGKAGLSCLVALEWIDWRGPSWIKLADLIVEDGQLSFLLNSARRAMHSAMHIRGRNMGSGTAGLDDRCRRGRKNIYTVRSLVQQTV